MTLLMKTWPFIFHAAYNFKEIFFFFYQEVNLYQSFFVVVIFIF